MKNNKINILSIDIGLIHLALLQVSLNSDYLTRNDVILEDEIILCEFIDITELNNNCQDPNCELYHDKIICDYIMHLFKKYKNVFESADIILIERQPPTGLVAVEQLIMYQYRSKSILVSPTAMLNYFNILDFEYLDRKKHTEQIAVKYLSSFKIFVFSERRHDMADAFCILYYYLSILRKNNIKKLENIKFKEDNKNYISNLKKYIYNDN